MIPVEGEVALVAAMTISCRLELKTRFPCFLFPNRENRFSQRAEIRKKIKKWQMHLEARTRKISWSADKNLVHDRKIRAARRRGRLPGLVRGNI